MVGLMRVDDKVDLKLYRGGKPKNISVKIGKDDKIADASALTKDVSPRLAGATFAPLDKQTANAADVDSGVVVKDVPPDSPAAKAGLEKIGRASGGVKVWQEGVISGGGCTTK